MRSANAGRLRGIVLSYECPHTERFSVLRQCRSETKNLMDIWPALSDINIVNFVHGGTMKLANGKPAMALVVLLALGTGESLAQQSPTKRNFQAEINAALQAARPPPALNFSVLW